MRCAVPPYDRGCKKCRPASDPSFVASDAPPLLGSHFKSTNPPIAEIQTETLRSARLSCPMERRPDPAQRLVATDERPPLCHRPVMGRENGRAAVRTI